MPYLLAEIFSCSTIYSKREFANISNLRFIGRTSFEHEKSFVSSGPGLEGLCLILFVCGWAYCGSSVVGLTVVRLWWPPQVLLLTIAR